MNSLSPMNDSLHFNIEVEFNNSGKTLNEIFMEDINGLKKEIDKIKLSIEKTNKAIEELYSDKVEGNIPIPIFNNLLKRYNDSLKIDNHQKELLEHERLKLLSKIQKLDYDSCSKIVKKFLEMKKTTRALIVELIDKVEIDENKNVKVYFKFNELSSYIR